MRYAIVFCIIGLGFSLISFGLAGSPGDRLAAFDPHYPAALLLSIDSHLRAFRTATGELLRGLIDRSTAAFRERIQHGSPPQPPAP